MVRLGQALILAGIVCAACVLAAPPKLETAVESPDSTELRVADPPPLDPADAKLFGRLKAHIDHRVETKLVESLQEAGKPQGQRQGIGSLVLAAIGAVVKAVLKAVLMALVLAVLAALFWKYGLWLVAGFVIAVAAVAAPVSWLTARAK